MTGNPEAVRTGILRCNAPDGSRNSASLENLRREHAALSLRFIKLWMARNRRSEIGITLKAYRQARSAEISFQGRRLDPLRPRL